MGLLGIPLGLALLVGLAFQMPAYYLTWGRHPLATGLLLLPAALSPVVVVAALAAKFFGLVEPQETLGAELGEALVGEGRLLPAFGVRCDLLGDEAADRLAELIVFVVEQRVAALRVEVRLDDGV